MAYGLNSTRSDGPSKRASAAIVPDKDLKTQYVDQSQPIRICAPSCSRHKIFRCLFDDADLAKSGHIENRQNLTNGINYWPVLGWGDGFAVFSGGGEPGFFGEFEFSQGRFRRLAKRGAGFQVGDVGDVTAIGFAVENIDVVVFHDGLSSNCRLYASTNLRSWRIW